MARDFTHRKVVDYNDDFTLIVNHISIQILFTMTLNLTSS